MKQLFIFNEKRRVALVALFLFTFILIPFLSAVPPQTSIDNSGLQIFFPSTDVVMEGVDIHMHTHVINATHQMTNDTATCYVHLYNRSGKHILEKYMGWDGNNLEWELTVDGNNFTVAGNPHSYVIVCNTTTQVGGVKGEFFVTGNGFEVDQWFLLIILLISGGIIILGFSLKDPPMVILGSFGLYFIGLWIIFNGIVGIRDTTYTLPIAIIILAVAAYISVRSAWELINDEK